MRCPLLVAILGLPGQRAPSHSWSRPELPSHSPVLVAYGFHPLLSISVEKYAEKGTGEMIEVLSVSL